MALIGKGLHGSSMFSRLRAQHPVGTEFLRQYARARVMEYYPISEKSLPLRDIRARPAFVLGPVDMPPWNRQRRFPGTTFMMQATPALVLAQHLGRNLRFKGS